MKRTKFGVLLMAILLALTSIIFFAGCFKKTVSGNEKVEPIEIIEIEEAQNGYLNPELGFIELWKHFIICNIDEDDVEGLREIAEDYIVGNMSSFKAALSEYALESEGATYSAWFYRESKFLPRDWKPYEGFDSDTIESHKADLVVLANWTEGSSTISYSITLRSRKKMTYGYPIIRYKYVNDIVVQIEDYKSVGSYDCEIIYPDTDDDGVSNKEEIEQGTDPLSAY